jgi:transcription initiation factor TFIID subunit 5
MTWDFAYFLFYFIFFFCQTAVSPSKLPSICFHTFLNTSRGLNCVDMSRDATTVVAGFADSSVKFYRFVQKQRSELSDEDRMDLEAATIPEVAPQMFHTLSGHAGAVYGVSLDVENDFVLSCGLVVFSASSNSSSSFSSFLS